jgi:hypothetical protein
MHIRTAFRSGLSISGVTAPALAIVCVCAGASPASAQPAPTAPKAASLAPTDAWNTYSADITLRRHRVDAAGQPVGDSVTAQQYHWERSSATGHWKTTMTLGPASPALLRTLRGTAALDDRMLVARIEDDEDGSGPRIYNKRGDLLRAPGALDQLLPPSAGTDPQRLPHPPPARGAGGQRPQATQSASQWIDNHFIKRNGHEARRRAFQRQHGPPVGHVRGLDRYVTTHGDRTDETLVDPQLQVPVETNVVREGRLVSHRTMSYAAAGSDLVVRRSIRTERLVSSKTGERAIVEIEFANVRLEQRR